VAIPLQKFLAGCGVASRREAERLIAAGQVTVNGDIAKLGVYVDPAVDVVKFRDQPLHTVNKTYLVLNKPSGVVTTTEDDKDRKTVLDCLNNVAARLFPVGRLGLEEEGAILITNDGELSYRLLQPDYNVEGIYLAWVEGAPDEVCVAKCEQGIVLSDDLTVRMKMLVLYTGVRTTLVRLTLREGKRTSVRRVCAMTGHPVLEIRRIAFAGVNVEGLKPGESRPLTLDELTSLRRLTGLDS
jgi:23S rRNA pseudouridine2605 synthase